MNEFRDIIERIWRNTWLCWAAARNKRQIVSKIRNEQTDPNLRLAWNDLLVRARWASQFLERQMKPEIAKTYDAAGGTNELPEWKPMRLRTPESFTVEPCALCKQLEESFSPNDEVLRQATTPFDGQMNAIYSALIADSYKAGGMGITLDKRVQEIRQLPEADGYDEAFLRWDKFIRNGLGYLVWGRGCFSIGEIALETALEEYQGSRANLEMDEVNLKYALTENDTIKAEGGLFALNKELLCKTCKGNLEPDPVIFR